MTSIVQTARLIFIHHTWVWDQPVLSLCSHCQSFFFFFYFFIEFTEVTLVNKIIWVSSVQLYIHHPYIILCVHHPNSSLLTTPCIPPLPSSTSPHPFFPLVIIIQLPVFRIFFFNPCPFSPSPATPLPPDSYYSVLHL